MRYLIRRKAKTSKLIAYRWMHIAARHWIVQRNLDAAEAMLQAYRYAPNGMHQPVADILDNLIRQAIPIQGEHDQQCVRRHLEQVLYDRMWPNYCRTCQGTGMLWSPGDWVPYGEGSAQLPDDVDPCPDCEEKGLCPRCGGTRTWHEDQGRYDACPTCGLVNVITEVYVTPGRPPIDCYCWETKMYAEMEQAGALESAIRDYLQG